MAEVYVTLGEAAELERVKYNTMVKRVLRKQATLGCMGRHEEQGHHGRCDVQGCQL